MSCGAGRGRGWLNLSKTTEPPKPTGLVQPLANHTPSQINIEHKELVDRIRELSLNDDGIRFNQKMQHIQNYWMQNCANQEDVEASFEEVYNFCLHDVELGSKLVSLMASRTFVTQKIHDCSLRHQFLKHLQQDFENSNQLQTTNPLLFRNCVHMLGEFFSKARLSNGEPYSFLAAPFLSCLELLLNSKTLPDLILFSSQLFLNGSSLKNTLPDDLTKLGIKLRAVLVLEPQLVKEAKLWLLLALDLFSVRFGLLPPEIYKFYESQLGSVAMANLQRLHDSLSIQTLYASKVLDSYQSNVNVLQISTSSTEGSQNDQTHFSNTSDYSSSSSQQSNNGPLKNKEKTGRPILGAGARFIKKGNDENGAIKQNNGRIHSKKHPPSVKTNKGWEHDDRFENDYN